MAKALSTVVLKMDTEDALKVIQPLIDEVNDLRRRVLELENIVIGDGR